MEKQQFIFRKKRNLSEQESTIDFYFINNNGKPSFILGYKK